MQNEENTEVPRERRRINIHPIWIEALASSRAAGITIEAHAFHSPASEDINRAQIAQHGYHLYYIAQHRNILHEVLVAHIEGDIEYAKVSISGTPAVILLIVLIVAFTTISTGLVIGFLLIIATIVTLSSRARTFGRYLVPYYIVRDLTWYIHWYTTSIRTEVDQCRARLVVIEAKIKEIAQEIYQETAYRQDIINRLDELRRIVNEVSDYWWNPNDEVDNNNTQDPAVRNWNNSAWNVEENDENRAPGWQAWPETTNENIPEDSRWAAPAADEYIWPEPNNNTEWPTQVDPARFEDYNGDENYRHPDSPRTPETPIPGLLFFNGEGQPETSEQVTELLLPVANNEISRRSVVNNRGESSSGDSNRTEHSEGDINRVQDSIDSLFFEFKDSLSDSSSDTSAKDTDSEESDSESSEEDPLVYSP